METAAIVFFESAADLPEDRGALIEHRHLDIAAEDLFELGARDRLEVASFENRCAAIVSALQTSHHRVGVRELGAVELGREDNVLLEIGKREVSGRREENEIHRVGIVPVRNHRKPKVGPRECFVGHPLRDAFDTVFVHAHVSRKCDDGLDRREDWVTLFEALYHRYDTSQMAQELSAVEHFAVKRTTIPSAPGPRRRGPSFFDRRT